MTAAGDGPGELLSPDGEASSTEEASATDPGSDSPSEPGETLPPGYARPDSGGSLDVATPAPPEDDDVPDDLFETVPPPSAVVEDAEEEPEPEAAEEEPEAAEEEPEAAEEEDEPVNPDLFKTLPPPGTPGSLTLEDIEAGASAEEGSSPEGESLGDLGVLGGSESEPTAKDAKDAMEELDPELDEESSESEPESDDVSSDEFNEDDPESDGDGETAESPSEPEPEPANDLDPVTRSSDDDVAALLASFAAEPEPEPEPSPSPVYAASATSEATTAGAALDTLSGAGFGDHKPINRLAMPTPGGGDDTFGPGSYSTLMDVREHLSEDAEVADQRDALDRVVVRARRRLSRLQARGFRVHELEANLRAAEDLGYRGEVRPALLMVEEVLVLAKVMSEYGQAEDPLEARIREHVARALEDHLAGTAFGEKLESLAAPLLEALEAKIHERIEDGERELRERIAETEQGIEARVRERVEESERRLEERLRALEEQLHGTLDERLEGLLSEDRFEAAAAAATAARPDALLDRPETLARIDALAQRAASDLLDTTEFREEVDVRVRAQVKRAGGLEGLDARIEDAVRGQIEKLFGSKAFDALLAKKVQGRLRAWQASAELGRVIEAHTRDLLAEQQPAASEDGPDPVELAATIDAHLSDSLAFEAAIADKLRTSGTLRELIDQRLASQVQKALSGEGLRDQLEDVWAELLAGRTFGAEVDRRVDAAQAKLAEATAAQLNKKLKAFLDAPGLARKIELVLSQSATAPAVASSGVDEATVRRIVAELGAQPLDANAVRQIMAEPLEDMAKQVEHFLREGPTAPGVPPKGAGMDEDAVRELLAEELGRRVDPATLARTPQFQEVLEERFKELLIREFKKRKKKG